MITAQFPFYAPDEYKVAENIQHGRWNRKHRSLTPQLTDLLNKLLNPDPLKRASTMDCLSHPWVTGGKAPATTPTVAASSSSSNTNSNSNTATNSNNHSTKDNNNNNNTTKDATNTKRSSDGEAVAK